MIEIRHTDVALLYRQHESQEILGQKLPAFITGKRPTPVLQCRARLVSSA